MAQPSPPTVATEDVTAEVPVASSAMSDVDGASAMSRATMYSHASTAPQNHSQQRGRGYRTELPRRSSDSYQQHQQQHHQQHLPDQSNKSCNSTVASAGSGGSSQRSSGSRGRRDRNRSRSHSHEHYRDSSRGRSYSREEEEDQNDYYRDRDRHPPQNFRGDGRYEEDDNRSRRGYDDDRYGESYPRRSNAPRDDASYGSYKSSDTRRRRARSEGSQRDATDRDYYGPPNSESRKRQTSDGSVDPPPASPPVKEEWPPCFDTDGSSFVFDNRSAMFYEALSDFFYDPKSKLYYGNRKGAYFRYDATLDPPTFVEVQKVANPSTADQDGVQSTMDQVPIHKPTTAEKGSGAAMPKIAIKLKTKKLKKPASTSSSPSTAEIAPTISKKRKEQIANIGKWTEKQAELKQGDDGSTPTTVAPASTNKPSATRAIPAAAADTSKVRMTAKGEPICLVCKRKFPNIDKLRLHERASELHQKNLQKLEQQEQAAGAKRKSPDNAVAPAPAAAAGYQDRAQKRRQLHGPDMIPERRATSMLLNSGQEPPPPAEALDESHVGHQMLQKLGWKGHGNDDGKQNGEGRRQNNNSSTTDQLRKDWDRIEALAKNNHRR